MRVPPRPLLSLGASGDSRHGCSLLEMRCTTQRDERARRRRRRRAEREHGWGGPAAAFVGSRWERAREGPAAAQTSVPRPPLPNPRHRLSEIRGDNGGGQGRRHCRRTGPSRALAHHDSPTRRSPPPVPPNRAHARPDPTCQSPCLPPHSGTPPGAHRPPPRSASGASPPAPAPCPPAPRGCARSSAVRTRSPTAATPARRCASSHRRGRTGPPSAS